MSKKLYNVTVRVVGLIWADDETEAIDIMRYCVDRANSSDFEALRDTGDNAFISEPAPELGWTP